MKKLESQEFQMKDYPLKEALKRAKDYLNTPRMHLIVCMSPQIFQANVLQTQKIWLDEMDLCIFEEEWFRPMSKLFHFGRNQSMKTEDFLMLYLKYLASMKINILVVADSDENVDALKKYLGSIQDNLLIEKDFVLKDPLGKENMYNEINDTVPQVVISALPMEIQNELMIESKTMINAKTWLGLSELSKRGRKGYKRFS